MSEIIQPLIDSLAHLPLNMDHPLSGVGSIVVAGAAILAERTVFNHTDDSWAAQFPNPALLEQSIKPDADKVRRARLAPAMAVTAGLGALAFQLLGNPTYESTSLNHAANVVVVADASLSMLNTKDVGTAQLTRFTAAKTALQEASYPGNLGIVQSGASVRVVAPLGSDKNTLAQAEKPQVDPNGGNMVQAINTAASLLPIKNGKHEGSLLVISDGTIDDTAPEITAAATAIKQSGISIKVVVPGTAQGKYQLGVNPQQIPSGASPDVFAGLGANNVIEAKDAPSITKAIQETLVDAGTNHENHPWYVPGMIGALLLGGGMARIKWLLATRKI
jgi:hypothetical protein